MERRIQQTFVTSPLTQSEFQPLKYQKQRAKKLLRQQIGNSIKDLSSPQLVPQAIINLGLGQQVLNAKQLISILQNAQNTQQLQSLNQKVRNIARQIKKMQKVKGITCKKQFLTSKQKKDAKSSYPFYGNIINSRIKTNHEEPQLYNCSGISSITKSHSPKQRLKKAINDEIQRKKKWQTFYDFSKMDKIVADNVASKKEKARIMNKRVQTIFQKQRQMQKKKLANFQISKFQTNHKQRMTNGNFRVIKKQSLKTLQTSVEKKVLFKKLNPSVSQQQIKRLLTKKYIYDSREYISSKSFKSISPDVHQDSSKQFQQKLKTNDPVKQRALYSKTSQKLSRSSSNNEMFQIKLQQIHGRKALLQGQFMKRQIRSVIEKERRIQKINSSTKETKLKKRIQNKQNRIKNSHLRSLQINEEQQLKLKQQMNIVNCRKQQFLKERSRKIKEALQKQQLKRTVMHYNKENELLESQNGNKRIASMTLCSIKNSFKDKRQYKIKQFHKKAQQMQSFHIQVSKIKQFSLNQLQKQLAQLCREA